MRLAAILLIVAIVGALARPQAQTNAAIEAVCLAFQVAQNSLNGTAAGNLFTTDGLMEVPAGSPPNIGPAAIAKSFNAYFATLDFQQEVILTPILINANWATYTKLATGRLKSGAPFSSLELNWYEFDLSGPVPQISAFRALFADMLNNTSPLTHMAGLMRM